MKMKMNASGAHGCLPARRVLCAGAFLLAMGFASAAAGATAKLPLKAGWKFVKADDPKYVCDANLSNEVRRLSAILDRADRGDLSGAFDFDWAKPEFDDSAWTDVRVPHDWGVMKSFDPALPYGDAFLDVTGVGWYRTSFVFRGKTLEAGGRSAVLPPNGKVIFECDGAMSFAQVFVNGRFVGGWPYGYTRFRLDLTPHLRPDGANVLAVRCHNVPHSSRWYTGGGLYRNCRLLVLPEDHVVPGSVFITTPEVTAKWAKVRVRYEMSKSGGKERSFKVDSPRLWDVDDPYLYTVDVEGDAYRYGIRTISFNSDERRFQLNGRTVPLNGVSMHHDFGVLGAAWNRTAQKRRLALFKEAGVNAIRSSHNPPDEGLLELCDEMGILVKDEVFDTWRRIGDAGKRAHDYHLLFDAWHERDVRAWVRTDRNHPSVILYSVGNEVCDLKPWTKDLAGGVRTARRLAVITAEEDPTRPTCNANNEAVNFTNDYPTVLGVMGCNYMPWQYPRLKAAYPDVPFFGTETVCAMSTRGEYRFPVVKRCQRPDEFDSFYMSSYGWEGCGWTSINSGWACPPDAQWHWMDKVGTCMGDFIWTGIDYLGGPYYCDSMRKRPRFADPVLQAQALADVKKYGMARAAIHSCGTGFLDLAGFKKDYFYLYQSRFLPDLPMAHVLPHWNWKGREGEVTPVYVFTSGDEGELFLNGRSLGRRRKQPGVWDRAYRLCWDDVRYEPGVLEVVVYKGGREWARETVRTTGPVSALKIAAENAEIVSDGEDVAYVNVCVVDAAGDVVPRTRNVVKFSVNGPGEVVATDNGDETNMGDFRKPECPVFNGLVQAIVRARPGASGKIFVTATADGCSPVRAGISVKGEAR